MTPDTSLCVLGPFLGKRIENAAKNMQMYTVEDLDSLDDAAWLRTYGIGRKSLRRIHEVLGMAGVKRNPYAVTYAPHSPVQGPPLPPAMRREIRKQQSKEWRERQKRLHHEEKVAKAKRKLENYQAMQSWIDRKTAEVTQEAEAKGIVPDPRYVRARLIWLSDQDGVAFAEWVPPHSWDINRWTALANGEPDPDGEGTTIYEPYWGYEAY